MNWNARRYATRFYYMMIRTSEITRRYVSYSANSDYSVSCLFSFYSSLIEYEKFSKITWIGSDPDREHIE